MNRRKFLQGTLMTAAAMSLPAGLAAQARSGTRPASAPAAGDAAFIIDTNVNLGNWPFRELKHGTSEAMTAKLRQHKVRQAWAGSFDALFHKNIDSVNERLTEDCRRNGGGVLVPFGTVNPAFPDWEEDLRRCHEQYRMPGIRLHPVYHGYTLESPEFKKLLAGAARRGIVVQIAIDMEDERMQHPLVDVPAVDVTPLAGVLREVPEAKLMLVNAFRHVRGERLRSLVDETDVVFEFSNLDGTAGVGRILQGNHSYLRGITMPLDRLAFGSHMPYFPLENSLFKLMESPLTREQIDALAFGSAERLLGSGRTSGSAVG